MPHELLVRKSHDDSGNCRVYYKGVTYDGKPIGHKTLYCTQEDENYTDEWLTCNLRDGEPDGPLRKDMVIIDADTGETLRGEIPELPEGGERELFVLAGELNPGDKPMTETGIWKWQEEHQEPRSMKAVKQYLHSIGFVFYYHKLDSETLENLKTINKHFWWLKHQKEKQS